MFWNASNENCLTLQTDTFYLFLQIAVSSIKLMGHAVKTHKALYRPCVF